jgi:hypothetical protein
MSSKFLPIDIPGGVVAKATKKQQSSNWAEVNLVRWQAGQMAPVGGQSQYDFSFASRCKAIHGWYDLNFLYYTAYLCEQNLYIETNGVLTEITPVDGIAAPTGSVGGYGDGYYQDGVSLYGKSPNPPFAQQVSELPDAYSLDNFGQILYAMTSADARLLKFDPTLPPASTVVTLRGSLPWSIGALTITMGQSNPSGATSVLPGMTVFNNTTKLAVGTVSSFPVGSTTLTLTAGATSASTSRRHIKDKLAFTPAPDYAFIKAAAQTADSGRGTVPLGRCFVITPERFVIIFGSFQDGTDSTADNGGGGFNRFAWCDQENPGAWDYSNVVSQAGFLDVEPSSPIITALCTRTGTLIWTGKKVYRSRFLGAPYIYNCEELGDNCAPWSPQSATTTTALALWMSDQGMFSYDGTSVLPVACLVWAWILDDVDPLTVREQSCCAHVSDFSEFWWFFPQNGQPYNTRVAIYNYKEGWWSQGIMSRSAGNTSAYNAYTVMADGLIAFRHELGSVYGNADLPWAETFDLNLGQQLITVKQLIPDIEGDIENVQYTLFYRNSRSTGAPENQTRPAQVRPDGYVDFRTTGRDIRLRFELIGPEVNNVTVGAHLIDAVPRGDR